MIPRPTYTHMHHAQAAHVYAHARARCREELLEAKRAKAKEAAAARGKASLSRSAARGVNAQSKGYGGRSLPQHGALSPSQTVKVCRVGVAWKGSASATVKTPRAVPLSAALLLIPTPFLGPGAAAAPSATAVFPSPGGQGAGPSREAQEQGATPNEHRERTLGPGAVGAGSASPGAPGELRVWVDVRVWGYNGPSFLCISPPFLLLSSVHPPFPST